MKHIEGLLTIFNELQSTNSTNQKQAILKKYESNSVFKTVVYFLINPYITTGISGKKINKELGKSYWQEFTDLPTSLIKLLVYIEDNNTGRDVDISICQKYISQFADIEERELVKSIVTKSLKMGINAKLVNKVYGVDYIPMWEVQLGSSFDKLKLKNNEYFYLSQKLNGNRCSFVDDALTSRQGKEFTGLQHIIEDLNVAGLESYFIDGELVRKNTDGVSDGENFRIGTGIINSDDADKSQIKLVIFDMFPAAELSDKQSQYTYKFRKEKLLILKDTIAKMNLQNIEVVNMVYEGADKAEIDRWLDYAVQNGWEGLMLNKDTTYKCKRTADLIKIKRFYTVDLKVIGYEEGAGRLKGTLGALIVDFKGNSVNVGSGFDDVTRTEIWSNRGNILGRIIEVKYKDVSKDKKTGLESLQFPIYITLREIGKEVSYN